EGRRRSTNESKLFLALFPGAAQRDPERQQDQANVEHERTPADIEKIEAEFLPPRYVARRIDLGDAGQSGRHRAAPQETGNGVQRDWGAAAVGVDFFRPQRARTDEAHVA